MILTWEQLNKSPGTCRYYNPVSAGTVYIRQILTYKDDPHAKRIKIFMMAVDP